MNLLEYLPPTYSILTIGLSVIASANLRSRVSRFLIGKTYRTQEDVIVNIALSWEIYVNFFNFMIGAAISIFVTLTKESGAGKNIIVVGCYAALLIILLFMIYFLSTFDVEGIEGSFLRVPHVGLLLKPATIANWVMVFANILLIVATYVSQQPQQQQQGKSSTTPKVTTAPTNTTTAPTNTTVVQSKPQKNKTPRP